MKTVNQPTRMPTRKLTAGMVAAAVAAMIKAQVIHMWPHLAEPLIWEPLPILIGFGVGYLFVKDRPNVDSYAPDDQRGA